MRSANIAGIKAKSALNLSNQNILYLAETATLWLQTETEVTPLALGQSPRGLKHL